MIRNTGRGILPTSSAPRHRADDPVNSTSSRCSEMYSATARGCPRFRDATCVPFGALPAQGDTEPESYNHTQPPHSLLVPYFSLMLGARESRGLEVVDNRGKE